MSCSASLAAACMGEGDESDCGSEEGEASHSELDDLSGSESEGIPAAGDAAAVDSVEETTSRSDDAGAERDVTEGRSLEAGDADGDGAGEGLMGVSVVGRGVVNGDSTEEGSLVHREATNEGRSMFD